MIDETNASEVSRTVIKPMRGLQFLDLRELWRYRELLYFLTWRDIKVRYKQTVLGVLWAILQPLFMMLIFTFVFGRFAKLDQRVAIPYNLFALAGLLPWQLFSRTLTDSSNSLLNQQKLITKIYFPRILIPASTCCAALVDFLVGSLILVVMMVWQGYMPTWRVVFLPLFLLLMLMTSLGVGFWLSSLNAEYRDIRYTVPFLIQFWMFATPVIYPSNIVPHAFKYIIALNPMTGVVEGIRWALFDYGYGPGKIFVASIIVSLFCFITGIVWFRSRERKIADYLG
jgi:lipopolysaccharide transport system permease protein